jgi:selenocysteine-specific elongation factor
LSYLLNVEISMVTGAIKGIQNRQRVKIYLGTSITNAMVVLIERDRLNPGESSLAQIRLMRPVAALPRDAFVISPLNFNTVIAGGRILEIPREKYRAVKSKCVLPVLSALQKENIEAYVENLFENARDSLICAKLLSKKTGLPPATFERVINSKVQKGQWVYIKGHGAIKKCHLSDFQKQFKAAVTDAFGKDPMKKCIGINEVAARLGDNVDSVLLKITADALCENGDIIGLDGGYLPTESHPSVNALQDRQLSFVLDYIHGAGLTPISPGFFAKQHPTEYGRSQARKMFNYLYRTKKLVGLSNNRFLSLEAFDEIKRRMAQAIQDRGFVTVTDCKDLFGYGRSVGAHVLDYLNQVGFTVRTGDKHYLKKGSSQ